MITVAILVTSTVLSSNILQFSNYVDAKFYDDLDRALNEMLNEIELLEEKAARIASLYFASDTAITNAMRSGNRQALRIRAAALYEETEVEYCAITDTDGKVLVRPHASGIYDDNILSMHIVREALSGRSITGSEYDLTMDMGACSGSPIFDEQDRLLGAVVVGFRLDTDKFVDKQKKIAACEITVFQGDVRVATTVLNREGNRAKGTKAAEYVSQKVLLEGEIHTGRVRILTNNALAKYIPIMNPEGKVIGMLFAGHYLKEKTDRIFAFIQAGLLSTLVLLIIGIFIISFITAHISKPINIMLDKVHYDSLTGIYNRRFFDENLDRLIKTLSRSNGTLSLMMIDIDFFKKFNDTYGHSTGDECLRIVARTLMNGIKRTGDFVARYGGEEFVVVMPNTDENGAQRVAQELLEDIRACNIPHEKSEIADRVTVSIGVTTGKVDYTQSGIEHVKKADQLLYKSKQEGRNRYSYADLEQSVTP